MTYVVINLVASLLFVTAIAFVYAATGTVNMADLAEKIGGLARRAAHRAGPAVPRRVRHQGRDLPALLLAARLVPDRPHVPVTAVFAGLLTKVGVYAMVRTQTLLFPGDRARRWLAARASPGSPWSSACSAPSPRTT